jgi:crotonobetainyl-CoA:carnitine CoA-transferase CaiB-like acyl-CoA transferase
LKSERGQQVFWRLIETADVIVENNRKGSLERLGLSYEDVKRRRPDIIYASLNAFGHDGPWSERAGWEQLAQAVSGIQVRRGGRDGAPITLPYPMNDYGTGLLGAYAVSLALHERNNTGRGQAVDGGLALTAGLLQSPYFLDFKGYQRDDPEGLDIRGFSALSRLYQASDGWLYMHCESEDDWRNLASIPEFAALEEDARFNDAVARATNDEELQVMLSQILSSNSRGHWSSTLDASGVSIIKNEVIEDFRNDPSVRKAGLIATRDHPGLGQADHLGVAARLSATPARLGRPSPVLGADTREILEEIGYGSEEIQELESERIVVQTI